MKSSPWSAANFDYYVPQQSIAQHPLSQRDQSRLMVYDRKTFEISHRNFSEFREISQILSKS